MLQMGRLMKPQLRCRNLDLTRKVFQSNVLLLHFSKLHCEIERAPSALGFGGWMNRVTWRVARVLFARVVGLTVHRHSVMGTMSGHFSITVHIRLPFLWAIVTFFFLFFLFFELHCWSTFYTVSSLLLFKLPLYNSTDVCIVCEYFLWWWSKEINDAVRWSVVLWCFIRFF